MLRQGHIRKTGFLPDVKEILAIKTTSRFTTVLHKLEKRSKKYDMWKEDRTDTLTK
jgi:hypothetical protein